MSDESENEVFGPFSGSSDDNYEPSDDGGNSDDSIPGPSKKNRKVVDPSKWTRNVKKKLLATGKRHVNTCNKVVDARMTGENCKCRYKCFDKINDEERQLVLRKFGSIGEKVMQDTYLCGLISSLPVKRTRPKTGTGGERSVSHKYTIRIGQKSTVVCKKAFSAVHGISRKRVERLAGHLKSDQTITCPRDNRGKHRNRPNAVPSEIINQVDDHIKSFPKRASHYSRNKNHKKVYLSPELNIKKMYELYLEKYEPDMYEIAGVKDKKNLFKPKVTYDFYFRYFKANFNISFGSPRSDTCKTCDEYETKSKVSTLSDAEKVQLETKRKLHLAKSAVFFKELQAKMQEAKVNPEVETICFDHQQNAPLPKVPSGNAFYLRQLWVYNFCISVAKTGISHFFMYDETTGKKTPNETISFLQYFLEHIISKEVKVLYIFSDNCAAQNKNSALVWYLYTLAHTGRFKTICHRFPEPGHSFLPCDRSFGVVEKNIRRVERVFTPAEYRKLYGKSSKTFNVINVSQDMIFNFVETLKPFFKKTVVNKHRQKFAISKYKIFLYEQGKDELQCSETVNTPLYADFKIQKEDFDWEVPPLMYNGNLPLKKAKYDNVMTLANQYVPENDIGFYKNLMAIGSDTERNETDYTDDDGGE